MANKPEFTEDKDFVLEKYCDGDEEEIDMEPYFESLPIEKYPVTEEDFAFQRGFKAGKKELSLEIEKEIDELLKHNHISEGISCIDVRWNDGICFCFSDWTVNF